MDTKQITENYFAAVNQGGWEDYIAEDFTYGMCDSQKVRKGKEAYLKGAGQFYALSQKLEVKSLLVEGLKAAAINRYYLTSPVGQTLELEVAEFLVFNPEGKMIASTIYFDIQAFQKFMQAQ
ncbi:nuclear transport factor 2 family protein [Streptococcus oricebi]|uniref:Nuclear transport factor 2 family protein n=1 Tax=Streptococcus oricebi TaxID=1547447 RepID=A0ABS5B159_9STRE|nr:hypothetical protein [Streptococcus oricebi]MBP2622570.1 hypothetical protein [Streptococcus oricebi]